MLDNDLISIVEFRHGRIACFRSDRNIGRALRDNGEFGEDMVRALVSVLQPGDTAVDVGANIGTMTLPMAAKVGAGGRVVAIESQRLFHYCLCTNLMLNGLTNVQALHAAAGARSGSLTVPQIDVTKVANFGAVGLHKPGTPETVPLLRVDELGLESCAVLKIDVEGQDWFVLQGAAETVTRFRPCIFIEAKAGPATRQIIGWLQTMDYQLQWQFCRFVSARPLRGKQPAVSVQGTLGDVNIIAVPRERAPLFDLPLCSGPDADWHVDYGQWRERRTTQKKQAQLKAQQKTQEKTQEKASPRGETGKAAPAAIAAASAKSR